ncbi:MAG: TonB-dependent receptor [Alphaproteobacteria bacterium]
MKRNQARFAARHVLLAGVGTLALCIALGGSASAQSGPAAEEAKAETVVIIGQTIEETLPQELKKYGSDLAEISSEEVRNAGYVDVGQALQMAIPGVYVAPRNGAFSYMDISVQGSRTQDMLFLVDGVRINNRLYGTTITDTLPAAMVERIEVLKGGESLFYGTSAASGVINIVTRGYTDQFDGLATVGGDTNNTYHLDAYVRGKLGPGNYVLYGSKDQSDGYDAYTHFEPSSTDHKREYNVASIGGKYRWDVTDRFSLDARYQHTEAHLDNLNPAFVPYSKNNRDEEIASVSANYAFSDQLKLLVKGYWHDWDSHYTTYLDFGGGPTLDSDNLFWGFWDKGVNALLDWAPGGPLEYIVGYDYQRYWGRDEVLVIAPMEEEVNAIYGQIRTTDSFLKNGALSAGVRYNRTGGSEATVWNASGKYNFTDYLYVQGNVGTSFVLPDAESLYARDIFDPVGNANLKPEESKSINVSLGGTVGSHVQWQATAFGRDIDNLIGVRDFVDDAEFLALYPNLDPLIFEPNGLFYNVPGTVEVRGFELMGNYQVGNGIAFSASYTHNDSKKDNGAGGKARLPRIPVDYAKLSASFTPTSGRWGVETNVLWTGEDTAQINLGGPTINRNYGDYAVVDLAAHYYLDAKQKHKVSLRLENLFDENYVTSVGAGTADDFVTRFEYGSRGVPQTLHLSYSYAF